MSYSDLRNDILLSQEWYTLISGMSYADLTNIILWSQEWHTLIPGMIYSDLRNDILWSQEWHTLIPGMTYSDPRNDILWSQEWHTLISGMSYFNLRNVTLWSQECHMPLWFPLLFFFASYSQAPQKKILIKNNLPAYSVCAQGCSATISWWLGYRTAGCRVSIHWSTISPPTLIDNPDTGLKFKMKQTLCKIMYYKFW